LIVGYEKSADGTFNLIINEPFPYDALGMPNPYYLIGGQRVDNNPGRYRIEYARFATQMRWTRTAYDIQRESPGGRAATSYIELAALILLAIAAKRRRRHPMPSRAGYKSAISKG